MSGDQPATASKSERKYSVDEFNLLMHPAIVFDPAIKSRVRVMNDDDNPFLIEACRAIIALPNGSSRERTLEFLDKLVDAHNTIKHAAQLAKYYKAPAPEEKKRARTDE